MIAMFVYISSLLLALSFKSTNLSPFYINMASNIDKQKDLNISLSDLLSSYPVLNKKCYIINESITKIKDVAIKKEENLDLSVMDSLEEPSTPVYVSYDKLTIKDSDKYQRVVLGDINILNYSSRKDINYKSLLSNNITLSKKNDKLLIYCTHTSESFKNSERYKFDYSGNYRSRDSRYNMLSVASIMSTRLIDKGISVVFNTTPHDYTSYTNAYTNSKNTIKNELLQNSEFGIAIDVHRDAYGDLSQSSTVNINGKKVAQIMIVLGIGTTGYENPYADYNLSLALNIMKEGVKMYNGLFRPILIRSSRYNQDLNKGSILVEIGATGNTLEEVYYAARCFANVLVKIYK